MRDLICGVNYCGSSSPHTHSSLP